MEAQKNKWIVEIFEDPSTHELMIELPPDLVISQGWECGDTLDFQFNEIENSVILKKVN